MENGEGARELINTIYDIRCKIAEKVIKNEEMKKDVFIAEHYTMSAIIGEYDAHGKPKFSNAESRAAEQCFRLSNNKIYKTSLKEILVLKKEIMLLEAEIEKNKNILEVIYLQ